MGKKESCAICKESPGTGRIREGNPDYIGKPICRECQKARKLLRETP